ncbi:MAG: aminotransferase class III-fold pyridoxal phosphate-dependent enzyme, partial [Microlunatus sp.]|nr:aminotransferase class III-fold pyridoxal phosphate-dependent enzyme [Microlunatus sp.]
EGGDNHIRPEFFQQVLEIVHANDALMIFDEVQTGMGTTGTAWAYQQLGVQPDLVAFSKKAQLGGVMAGGRIDEVPDNVFVASGRINSTWGGGLADMVRARRILEIVQSEGLIPAAVGKGEHFLAGLQSIAAAHPEATNPRGRGLFLALDLPDRELRDRVIQELRKREHVIVLPCGERSIRFRPALSVTYEEIDEALGAVARTVSLVLENASGA